MNAPARRPLLRWIRRAPAPAEELPAPSRTSHAVALDTRTEAARALAYLGRAGTAAVVVDATPDDWTPLPCADAHGTVLPTAEALANQGARAEGSLPHPTTGDVPCRCRYRAAAPGARLGSPERRPVDARWEP